MIVSCLADWELRSVITVSVVLTTSEEVIQQLVRYIILILLFGLENKFYKIINFLALIV